MCIKGIFDFFILEKHYLLIILKSQGSIFPLAFNLWKKVDLISQDHLQGSVFIVTSHTHLWPNYAISMANYYHKMSEGSVIIQILHGMVANRTLFFPLGYCSATITPSSYEFGCDKLAAITQWKGLISPHTMLYFLYYLLPTWEIGMCIIWGKSMVCIKVTDFLSVYSTMRRNASSQTCAGFQALYFSGSVI